MGLSATNAFFEQFNKAQAHRNNLELQKVSQLFQSKEKAKDREQQSTLTETAQAQQQEQFEASQAQQQEQFVQNLDIQKAQQEDYSKYLEAQSKAMETNIDINRQNAKMELSKGVSMGLFKPAADPETPGAFKGVNNKWYAPVSHEELTKKQQDDQVALQGRLQGLMTQHELGRITKQNNASIDIGLSLLDQGNEMGRQILSGFRNTAADPRMIPEVISSLINKESAIEQVKNQFNQSYTDFVVLKREFGDDSPEVANAAAQVEALGNVYSSMAQTFAAPTRMTPATELSIKGSMAVGNILKNDPAIRNLDYATPAQQKAIIQKAGNDPTLTEEDMAYILYGVSKMKPERPYGIEGTLGRGGFGDIGGAPGEADIDELRQRMAAASEQEIPAPAPLAPPSQKPAAIPNMIVAQGVTTDNALANLRAPSPEGLQRIFLGENKGDSGNAVLKSMLRSGSLRRRIEALGRKIGDPKLWQRVKGAVTKTIETGEAPKQNTKDILEQFSGFQTQPIAEILGGK